MTDRPVTDALLVAIRNHIGNDELMWANPPRPLTGGFWAEMYLVELAHAPEILQGRLVARIMPDPDTAHYETAIQRHVHRCGLPVPAIRAAGGPGGSLRRAWSLMDLAPGAPMLAGLSATSALTRLPQLLRDLPDLLAEATAALHRCPLEGLEAELGPGARNPQVAALLQRIGEQAGSIGRPDLGVAARRLLDECPPATTLCHGDIHPFNVLVSGGRWTLLDWSVATVADVHFDLGYTTLLLSNPPLGGPAPVRAAARFIGARMAERFLTTYAQRSGRPIDRSRLRWGRQLHALRALTESATWDAHGVAELHRGHPWQSLRGAFESELSAAQDQPPSLLIT